MNRFTLLTAAVVAVGVSACGGDGSSTPDPMTPPEATNQVPASALVSTEAFTRYAAIAGAQRDRRAAGRERGGAADLGDRGTGAGGCDARALASPQRGRQQALQFGRQGRRPRRPSQRHAQQRRSTVGRPA
jgi:hypothetical protein